MSRRPVWVAKHALLLLHEESLAAFGGPRGLRDAGLLDSALTRPLNLHAYNPKSSIPELAAACAFGIARNHPFVDGNKRAAFLSIGLFLAANGYELRARQLDAIQTILALAAGELNERQLAEWIAGNAVKKRKSKPE